ncbi:MAG: lasso peptide biosynthesis B2 protein [Myxococcales bacterium]
MLALGRARRVAALVVLRLSLPSRLAREPLDSLLASLTPLPACTLTSARAVQSLKRDVLRTEFAVRHVPGIAGTCLYRALARYAVLRQTGIDATFVMGVGPRGVDDEGHAWVEVEGKPFEEPDGVGRYAVTYRYPPAPNTCKPVHSERHAR